MVSKTFDIVTKPYFNLVFSNRNKCEPTTIDISVYNPNHETTFAYFVRVKHQIDFVVVLLLGLLQPVDRKIIRITRRPNVYYHCSDMFTIFYTEVPAETPRVNMKMFENKEMVKRKELGIKHDSDL